MKEAYNYLMNEVGIKYGDSVVIGVSGGPDSMALLHLLATIKRALDIEVVCAHVNHNVRKESAEEKIMVENFCRSNSLVFEDMKIEDYGDDNFHNEARSIRYNYFGQIVSKHNAKFLMTAHHGDDLIETILMRIVRGSTLRGYSGFSKELNMENFKIIRPLIHVTKPEILSYLKENKVKFAEDMSNTKDVYTRNRFRKYIVPHFKKEDKNVHKKFYKFSKTLLEYNEYIDKQVEKVINKVYPMDVLNIELFKKEEHLIQTKIIYYILEHIYQDDLMLITDSHADLIMDLINNSKSNLALHLPNNIKAIKSYNNLMLIKENENLIGYEIEINDFANIPNGKNIKKVKTSKISDNNVIRLNSSEVRLPLYVRTRKDGDKIALKGMIGRKKVKDIFIDKKIPMTERDMWPIVLDAEDNIVWIPGLKKSKFDKTKAQSCDIILKYY